LFPYIVFYFDSKSGIKKAAYRVPISRFPVDIIAIVATSFHGFVKSYCATTNLLTLYYSSQFSFNKKARLLDEAGQYLKNTNMAITSHF